MVFRHNPTLYKIDQVFHQKDRPQDQFCIRGIEVRYHFANMVLTPEEVEKYLAIGPTPAEKTP